MNNSFTQVQFENIVIGAGEYLFRDIDITDLFGELIKLGSLNENIKKEIGAILQTVQSGDVSKLLEMNISTNASEKGKMQSVAPNMYKIIVRLEIMEQRIQSTVKGLLMQEIEL